MKISKKNNLIPTQLTISEQGYWKNHFRYKTNNTIWLGRIVESTHDPHKKGEDLANFFPYCIKPKCVVTKIIKKNIKTIHLGEPNINPNASNYVYLITMPCVPDLRTEPKEKRFLGIKKLIDDIESQAFHKSAKKSSKELSGRAGVVIGLNTFYSIDSTRNQEFKDYITLLATSLKTRALMVKIIPFFWDPWQQSINFQPSKKTLKNKVYTKLQRRAEIKISKLELHRVDKCYMLVRSHLRYRYILYPETRKTIEAFDSGLNLTQYFGKDRCHPVNSTIPYQRIRTTILHSSQLKKLSKLFAEKLPKNPQFVVSLDSDFVSLKTDKTGLLSHYDKIISSHYKLRKQLPSVMSTGYSAPDTEPIQIISIGIKLDMRIRMAVAKTMPLAVYMPEPNFAFHLPSTDSLAKLSYEKGVRKTMAAESRQFIKSAVTDNLINPSEMIFVNKGAIQTTIDEEWRTKTIQKHTKISQKNIFNKEVIKALNGLHQSYADKQIWSNNIYAALGRAVDDHITNAVVPMKKIRDVFDPYVFANDLKPQYGNYSKSLFQKALSFMDPFFLHIKVALNKPSHIDNVSNKFGLACKESRSEKQFLVGLFTEKVQSILQAEANLKKAGYSKQEILDIRTMAFDTGMTITQFFKEYLE